MESFRIMHARRGGSGKYGSGQLKIPFRGRERERAILTSNKYQIHKFRSIHKVVRFVRKFCQIWTLYYPALVSLLYVYMCCLSVSGMGKRETSKMRQIILKPGTEMASVTPIKISRNGKLNSPLCEMSFFRSTVQHAWSFNEVHSPTPFSLMNSASLVGWISKFTKSHL